MSWDGRVTIDGDWNETELIQILTEITQDSVSNASDLGDGEVPDVSEVVDDICINYDIVHEYNKLFDKYKDSIDGVFCITRFKQWGSKVVKRNLGISHKK